MIFISITLVPGDVAADPIGEDDNFCTHFHLYILTIPQLNQGGAYV